MEVFDEQGHRLGPGEREHPLGEKLDRLATAKLGARAERRGSGRRRDPEQGREQFHRTGAGHAGHPEPTFELGEPLVLRVGPMDLQPLLDELHDGPKCALSRV